MDVGHTAIPFPVQLMSHRGRTAGRTTPAPVATPAAIARILLLAAARGHRGRAGGAKQADHLFRGNGSLFVACTRTGRRRPVVVFSVVVVIAAAAARVGDAGVIIDLVHVAVAAVAICTCNIKIDGTRMLSPWTESDDCYLPPPPLLEGIADEDEPKYVALDGRDVAMPLLLPLPLARVVSTAPGAELK